MGCSATPVGCGATPFVVAAPPPRCVSSGERSRCERFDCRVAVCLVFLVYLASVICLQFLHFVINHFIFSVFFFVRSCFFRGGHYEWAP